jgi:hypothetical protein
VIVVNLQVRFRQKTLLYLASFLSNADLFVFKMT